MKDLAYGEIALQGGTILGKLPCDGSQRPAMGSFIFESFCVLGQIEHDFNAHGHEMGEIT
jgi:hypothetical protein